MKILLCVLLAISIVALNADLFAPKKIIPATIEWSVVTNWSTSPYSSTTLLGWDGRGEDPNTTTYHEVGIVTSNLTATVQWKGQSYSVVVESISVGDTLNRSYIIRNQRVYLGK